MEDIKVWQLVCYAAFSGALGALALVKLYSKKTVENHINKKLEDYKGNIQAKQRRLQSQLDALNHQRNLIQTNFLSKKIESIEALHVKINKIINYDFHKYGQFDGKVAKALMQYDGKQDQLDNEVMSGFIALGNELRNMIERNEKCRYELESASIYVPESVQILFMDVLIETKKIINEYATELLRQRNLANSKTILELEFSFRGFVDSFMRDYSNETRKHFVNLQLEIRKELEPVSIDIDDE